MSKQIQHIIVFSILALFSFLIWNYYFNKEKIIVDKPFTKGYSVENVELTITDETGKLSAIFKSPKMLRYTDTPVVSISSPLFWTFKDGKEHWYMQANKANYDAEVAKIELFDEVIARTINGDLNTSFEAKFLLVDLKNHIAQTNDGIAFKQQQFTMTGQIATFDLNNEILEVNNNVKAIYKAKN